jgi:hypothetical protein
MRDFEFSQFSAQFELQISGKPHSEIIKNGAAKGA